MVITRGVLVQCQGTTGFLLLVHEIASCQQHTIPAPPQNIHIQTQQKSGGKYDVRPGLYTEPGRDPPGLLPTNKAGILEVMKEVHHPDIVNVVVHFISPFSNGGRYEAYGRRTAPTEFFKNAFRWLALFDTTSRAWAAADGLCWHTSRESHPSEDLSELPHCLIPVSPGAVAGQEYHYQIADEGRAG